MIRFNGRKGECFAINVIHFEAIGNSGPLDDKRLRFTGDVSFVFSHGLLEDLACREQRHFDLVRNRIALFLAAVLDAVHQFAGDTCTAKVVGNLQVERNGK